MFKNVLAGQLQKSTKSQHVSAVQYLVEFRLSSLEHALLACHLTLQLLHTSQLPFCLFFSTLLTCTPETGTQASVWNHLTVVHLRGMPESGERGPVLLGMGTSAEVSNAHTA